MRKRDLYEVALKLLGVYMIIRLIERLESTIWWMHSYLFDFDPTAMAIKSIVSSWITISIGVLLVYFLMFRTQSLINAMTKHQRVEEDDLLTDFTSRDQLYEMTLIILGSILLITNLPELIYNLVTPTLTADYRYSGAEMLFISGLKALVGLLTIIYAKFVAKRLIRKPNDTLVDD